MNLEGALEEESPEVHDQCSPEPHGNGDKDACEFDVHQLCALPAKLLQ